MRDPFPPQGGMQIRSSQQERVAYVTPAMRVLAADPFQAQRQVGLLRPNVGFVCWTDAVVEGLV